MVVYPYLAESVPGIVLFEDWWSSTPMSGESETMSVYVPTNDGRLGRWEAVGIRTLDDMARDLAFLASLLATQWLSE